MINKTSLSRRQLLQVSTLGSLSFLGSHSYSKLRPSTLLYSRGSLPYSLIKVLPQDWRSMSIVPSGEIVNRIRSVRPDLLQISDGWAQILDSNYLMDLNSIPLLEQLALFAKPLTHLLRNDIEKSIALPIAFSPWLLVIGNRPDLVSRSSEGWNLLLDPTLRGKLVLPASPRVLMEIAQRLEGGLELLPALRRSVLTFDRHYSLNLLIDGNAEIGVMPARQAIQLLKEHPHLKAILPSQGTLLSWDLLVQPIYSKRLLPSNWIKIAWEQPLLGQLMMRGWVPPLPRAHLIDTLVKLKLPSEWIELIYPQESFLRNCSSLMPLEFSERKRLQTIWNNAMT